MFCSTATVLNVDVLKRFNEEGFVVLVGQALHLRLKHPSTESVNHSHGTGSDRQCLANNFLGRLIGKDASAPSKRLDAVRVVLGMFRQVGESDIANRSTS